MIMLLVPVLLQLSVNAIPPGEVAVVSSSQPHRRVEDYTFMFWANGWNQGALREPALLCIQTGTFGLVLDVAKADILRLGRVVEPLPYAEAVAEGIHRLDGLPAAHLELSITMGTDTYRCVRSAIHREDAMNFPVRIIESGVFFQRCDILQLTFADSEGRELEGEGRLEISAWPDRLGMLFEWTPGENASEGTLGIALESEGLGDANQQSQGAQMSLQRGKTCAVSLAVDWANTATSSPEALSVKVAEVSSMAPLLVDYNAATGWHRVALPKQSWSPADEPDRLERYSVSLENPSEKEGVFRLLFDAADGTASITGVSPMLRSREGWPLGIPVQISKNWHRQPDRRMLYEGPWFHGCTQVRLPAKSALECEFDLAWARWGGVPAASHAQLCLIGWGWNQLWEEVAIGSWGESICYEPDAIQRRCRIDDVRPLMVWGMNAEKAKWTWTHNVGGGDFLVYFDAQGVYQPLTRVRAAYQSYGPNLTDVTYAGVSADGCIAFQARVSTPRCDDINRAYHHLRVDILKPTAFSRLAFYQLGADRYHGHAYEKMAWGNEAGLSEEWTPKRGGQKYVRTGIPCPGSVPWFSLHEGIPVDSGKPVTGAWANRGLVIRSWRARLAGKEVAPVAAVYGTEDSQTRSANLEMCPPPDVHELSPGDFVEATLELLILPRSAEDYYGPNENLRASLRDFGNTWKPVYRQAAGNMLEMDISAGRCVSAYPLEIRVDRHQGAEVRLSGGLGYAPITFSGLKSPRGMSLWMDADGTKSQVMQAVHGNDFWQTTYDPISGTWALTYNVLLDAPSDVRRTIRLWLDETSGPTGQKVGM